MEKKLYKGVWVYCEQRNGLIKEVSLELLGEGRKLADQLRVGLCAVLIGNNLDEAISKIAFYGADQLIVVDNPKCNNDNDEFHSTIFSSLITNMKPEIVLVGGTCSGRSLAPRVAARLHTGLTADCTQLEIDADKRILLQTRPAFGGNLFATITCPEQRPQMATVRPGVFSAAVFNKSKKAEIISPEVIMPEKSDFRVIKSIISKKEKSVFSDKDIIVAFGRGIGSISNIKLVEKFSARIGGTIGASRAVVDAGWIDYGCQVGQTGKTVAPKVYIALGISGAVQHIAGMMSSKVIIAINKDKNAPIFKLASIGIVGDVAEILPLLMEQMDGVYSLE